MGRHRLHAGAGVRHPGLGLGRAPVRGQAGLPGVGGAVHGRVSALRSGHIHHRADPVPRPAGPRRRHDHAPWSADDGRGSRPEAHGPCDEHRGRARDAGADPRPHSRRTDHPERELAMDLLRERADRRAGRGLRPSGASVGQAQAHRPPGRAGPAADVKRRAAPHLRAGRDRLHRQLHLAQGARLVAGGPGADRAVRATRATGPAAAA